MTTFIYSVIVFAVLIFVHELGHFVTAKAFGVKVNEFALGMGPVLLKKQVGETQYSLRLVPIGGFCAMEGEDEDSDDDNAFNKKAAWQRGIILAAGSLMNVALTIVILSVLLFSAGYPTNEIREVSPESPAAAAGIIPGDEIRAINGSDIKEWDDIYTVIGSLQPGTDISVSIERNGQPMTLQTETAESEDGRTIIGVLPVTEKKPLTAIEDGFRSTWMMTVAMADILKQLFAGDVAASDLTGPVGIVYLVGDSAKMGVQYVAYLAALISLNLAMINLLPFPALDGGRLLFLAVRKITGKAITDDIEANIHRAGIILLLALMVYVTWHDILRFIVPIIGGK